MSGKKLSRRTFNAGVVAAGALAASGFRPTQAKTDIAVAKGPDGQKNVKAAIDELGGIGAFVSQGQTVGILANTIGRFPGSFTKPEIIRTVANLCHEAGAAGVLWFDWRSHSRLRDNKLIELTTDKTLGYRFIDANNAGLWSTESVPRGKVLKQVRICNALHEPDVLILLPLFKHHGASHYTGSLKLYMGATHPHDNRNFFHGSGRLEQCIADVNTVVRKPDLIVMDAMEVITTRGPIGPGTIRRPQKIVAGLDRVAIDTYCAPIQNIVPAQSTQIRGAYELGVGEMDLSKVTIREFDVA